MLQARVLITVMHAGEVRKLTLLISIPCTHLKEKYIL